MSRRHLTHKQNEFLDYLRTHLSEHRVWPTYREIVEHFEYRSPNSVTQNLQALTRKGFLRRDRNGYAFVSPAARDGSIDVRGTLRAGRVEPTEAARLSLATIFPDLTGIHALKLDAATVRTSALGEANYVFVAEGDVPEGETVVVLGSDRLALGRVGPGGTVETEEPMEGGEVIGRYAGHAGPYGVVRYRPEAVQA